MNKEEIRKLRTADFAIENTPRGDKVWILVTKEFINLFGKALDELEESEDKPMLHKIAVTKTEEMVLEEYYVMRGIKKQYDGLGNEKKVVCSEREVSQYPDLGTIAQFLSKSGADFVSVEHNYRFETDLPFC